MVTATSARPSPLRSPADRHPAGARPEIMADRLPEAAPRRLLVDREGEGQPRQDIGQPVAVDVTDLDLAVALGAHHGRGPEPAARLASVDRDPALVLAA